MTIRYTELDVKQIRENLKNYLKGRPEFRDYNFEGSGISFLIDLLAYNTAYTGFYANMVANEMFLDSSTIRENINSHAKALGYFPRSARAPKATVQITFDLTTLIGTPPSFIEVPRYTTFTARFENQSLNFYTTERYTLPNNGNNVYTGNIDIYQGQLLTHTFTVDKELFPNQRFILPNGNVDTTHLEVKVKDSASAVGEYAYTLADDINLVENDDRVYFIQETGEGLYEVFFGDGVVGKRVENGNIVSVTYLITNGADYNGITKFVKATINPTYDNFAQSVITINPASGGQNKEDNKRIKLLAPLFYEAQNRAVNAQDYKTLILRDRPDIEQIQVWGGEDNDPPRYGVVYIAAKPKNALAFNTIEKEAILNTIVRPRAPISIEAVIVDPEYMSIKIDSIVKFDSRLENLQEGDIVALTKQAIGNYRETELQKFGSTFRFSQFINEIDEASPSILSNETEITLKFPFIPILLSTNTVEFSFQTELDLGDIKHGISSIDSSAFITNNVTTYIADDGNGSLYTYRKAAGAKIPLQINIGSVDYTTGKIRIPSILIESLPTDNNRIFFFAKPKSKDFSSTRSQILIIEDNDISIKTVNEGI